MSFREQERALYDLVFDSMIRQAFIEDRESVLDDYDLSIAERADFDTIRLDALSLDARMRTYLLLSHWSKSFPVTFSVVSSLDYGIDTLKYLVDTHVMRTSPIDRTAKYGERLKDWLKVYALDSEEELTRILAILDFEYGMVLAEAALKGSAINGEHETQQPNDFTGEWHTRNISIAPRVCAVALSQPYSKLKEKFCPHIDENFWKQLSAQPHSREHVSSLLQQEDPRLVVSRAILNRTSDCEPVVDQLTIELSEGFAPLFQYIDGTSSVDDLLGQLRQAGANDSLIESVKSGFRELLDREMLKLN